MSKRSKGYGKELKETELSEHKPLVAGPDKRYHRYTPTEEKGDMFGSIAKGSRTFCGVLTKCLCCPFYLCGCGPIVQIAQGSIGLLVRNGRFIKIQPPGLYVKNICTEQYIIVNMKIQVEDIKAQNLLTKDNIQLNFDGVVLYSITDPIKAIFEVENYKQAINFGIQGVLKNIVGENNLQTLLEDTKAIDEKLQSLLFEKINGYGIRIHNVEVQEIGIPQSMQQTMAIVSQSEKEKEARIVMAEGQLRVATILKEAADETAKNPLSLQLQYMDVLKQFAAHNNSTVILPDSVSSLMANFMIKKNEQYI